MTKDSFYLSWACCQWIGRGWAFSCSSGGFLAVQLAENLTVDKCRQRALANQKWSQQSWTVSRNTSTNTLRSVFAGSQEHILQCTVWARGEHEIEWLSFQIDMFGRQMNRLHQLSRLIHPKRRTWEVITPWIATFGFHSRNLNTYVTDSARQCSVRNFTFQRYKVTKSCFLEPAKYARIGPNESHWTQPRSSEANFSVGPTSFCRNSLAMARVKVWWRKLSGFSGDKAKSIFIFRLLSLWDQKWKKHFYGQVPDNAPDNKRDW